MKPDDALLRLKEIKENLNENGIISYSGEQNLRSQLLSKLARLQNDTGWLIFQIETLTAEKEKLVGALSKPSVWAALTPSGKILEIQFGEQRPLMLPPFSNQDFPTWVGFIEVTEALASVGKGILQNEI